MHVNISEDILMDAITHQQHWREGILAMRSQVGTDEDRHFWDHELRAFDRLVLEVTRVLQPDQYQKRLELSTGKNGGKLEQDERVAPVVRPQLAVHVNDTVCLEPLTEQAASKLRVWGRWWYVQHGYKSGEAWLLKSIAKQPRDRKPKDVEVLSIHKTNDPEYVITKVVTYPEEFNYKKHNT